MNSPFYIPIRFGTSKIVSHLTRMGCRHIAVDSHSRMVCVYDWGKAYRTKEALSDFIQFVQCCPDVLYALSSNHMGSLFGADAPKRLYRKPAL